MKQLEGSAQMGKNIRPLSVAARAGLAYAAYEYLLIVLPVAMYLTLESIHAGRWSILTSPEWSIATLFLSFQAALLFARRLGNTGRKLSIEVLLFLALGVVVVVASAAVNTWMSLERESTGTLLLRVVLFALTSAAFIVLVGSARAAEKRGDRHA